MSLGEQLRWQPVGHGRQHGVGALDGAGFPRAWSGRSSMLSRTAGYRLRSSFDYGRPASCHDDDGLAVTTWPGHPATSVT
ncbi:hypothetical protein HBB16_20335 [Pseudonocardia sp. MCCB 268]|nr:hypothetical protein [Pseudonocardia cytotoxica]